MTQLKVRKSSRSREGKRDPSCVVSGIEKATASETTPRIPAHEMTNGTAHCGAGSRASSRGSRRRGRYVEGKTQTNRAAISASSSTAA